MVRPPLGDARESHGGQKKKIEDELGIRPASKAVVKADEVQYLDGGLPRHLVLGGDIVTEYQTRWDFTRDFVKTDRNAQDGNRTSAASTPRLPEEGRRSRGRR